MKYFDEKYIDSLRNKKKIYVTVKKASEIYPEIAAIEALHSLQGEIFQVDFNVDSVKYRSNYSRNKFEIVDVIKMKEKTVLRCECYDGDYVETISILEEWVKTVEESSNDTQ